MHDTAVNYFNALFQSSVSRQGGDVAACVGVKVNNRENK